MTCSDLDTEATAKGMRPLTFLQKKRERHGDVFTVRLVGQEPLVMVGDPELAKRVFSAPADVLHAGDGNRRVLGWLLGEHSLILLDQERHMSHRRLLLPPFHGHRMERQAEAMRTVVEEHLDSWPVHGVVPVLPRLRELTLDVVVRAVLGPGGAGQGGPLRGALLMLLRQAQAGGSDASTTRRLIDRVEALIDEEVVGRRVDPRSRDRDDVLSLLAEARDEAGSPMSDVEVRDELMTLIVAGTETTAASLAWALEGLSRAPGALAQVVEEAPDGGGLYTDAAIYETLRMRPAVPVSARLVKKGPFELGKQSIPEGRIIAVSALLIHHRPDIYPDPMSFRPERFLERRPGTYTWMPFGGGARRCIGAGFALTEMGIVLSTLLSRMKLRAATDSEPEGMRIRANTLVPARGAMVATDRRPVASDREL